LQFNLNSMNEKQQFLKEQILDKGYDAEAFTEHMATLKGIIQM